MSRTDGQVTLARGAHSDPEPLNMPVVAGDHLRTADGRIEILLPDGSALAIDRESAVDFQSPELVQLLDGSVRLTIPAPMQSASFRIDSPAGSVRITEAGDYRVTMLHGAAASSASNNEETQIEVGVLRGAADLFTDEGSTHVRPGEKAYASAGLLPSYTYAFDPSFPDDFDRWVEGVPEQRAGLSSQYLSPDMREYSSTLDEYGDWQYVQPYGYVWYPRVAAGWRPYYNGRWVTYPRYGWTWVGRDAFAWPTHHYGRWGYSAGVWFWVPASRWAPAYVSWAYAPGYVSWCPLGFDNRPVVGIGISAGRYGSPWNAWTVVSATHFGRGSVPQRVVRTAAWSRGTHPAFQVRQAAPGMRDVAVPRYVNRGDVIIQSPTARPMGPRRSATAGVARGRSLAVPNSRTNAVMDRGSRVTTPGSSVPVYRGNATRVPSASRYRTAPPGMVNAPARMRQTAPMSSPRGMDSPVYAPRYQPNYAPHYEPRPAARAGERATPRGSAIMRGTAAPSTPPAAAGAAPARPAPARGRGGAVAVPRRGGRGGTR